MTLGSLLASLALVAFTAGTPGGSPAPATPQPAPAVVAPATQGGTQVEVGPRGEHLTGEHAGPVDIITPHITDSHELELPFLGEIELPRWKPVHVGGLTVDLSPTKHVVMLCVAALLVLLMLIPTAISHERHTEERGAPKGWSAGFEAVVLYLRNEVILPNVGHHGNAYVPFALTLFFFILFANLLGLIPYGSTATGNISVTAMLAIITFVVVEISGVEAQGVGYLKTIFYIPPKDMPLVLKPVMFLIMTPVEIIGKITKPFALAVRLFANMTAGHVVLLALISLIFTFQSYAVATAPVAMGVAISMLELFVAFLQAYIFTILSCVFIGLIRSGGH
jgi:F-type H+-transporting ATPase subunit a